MRLQIYLENRKAQLGRKECSMFMEAVWFSHRPTCSVSVPQWFRSYPTPCSFLTYTCSFLTHSYSVPNPQLLHSYPSMVPFQTETCSLRTHSCSVPTHSCRKCLCMNCTLLHRTLSSGVYFIARLPQSSCLVGIVYEEIDPINSNLSWTIYHSVQRETLNVNAAGLDILGLDWYPGWFTVYRLLRPAIPTQRTNTSFPI